MRKVTPVQEKEAEEIYAYLDKNILPSTEELTEEVNKVFSASTRNIVQASSSPLISLYEAIAKFSQITQGVVMRAVSKHMWEFCNGEQLTLTAKSYGYERVSAKSTTLQITCEFSTDGKLYEGTKFKDANDMVWSTVGDVKYLADTPAPIILVANTIGEVYVGEPLNIMTPIKTMKSMELNLSTQVVGREEEDDISLKARMGQGIEVFGSQEYIQRKLNELNFVTSAFVYNNYRDKNAIVQGRTIEPKKTFVSIRLPDEIPPVNIAGDISMVLLNNMNWQVLTQPPYRDDATTVVKLRKAYGVTLEWLNANKYEVDEADATLNCICVGVTINQKPNGADIIPVFFYTALSQDLYIWVSIGFRQAFSEEQKQNFMKDLRTKIATIMANTATVGGQLTTSHLSGILQKDSIMANINIQSLMLSVGEAGEKTQSLTPDSDKYFKVHSSAGQPSSGIVIVESGIDNI